MVTRSTWDQYFMLLAEQAATRSTCSRLSVGAVIVHNRQVISTGYNGAPKGMSHCVHTDDTACKISVHAEANALIHDKTTVQWLDKKVMYVTHAPCYDCAKLIMNTDIGTVIYGKEYRSDAGLVLMREGMMAVERVA